jgi:WD40 repeat protein
VCLGHEKGVYESDTWVAAVVGVRVAGQAVAISGGCDLTVRRWDLRTGEQLPGSLWPLRGHLLVSYDVGVECLTTVERGGDLIVLSGGTDSRVVSYDFTTGFDGAFLEPYDGVVHERAVYDLAADVIDDEQVRVTSLDEQNTVRLWDLDTAELLAAYAPTQDIGVMLVDTAHVILHEEAGSFLLRLPPPAQPCAVP